MLSFLMSFVMVLSSFVNVATVAFAAEQETTAVTENINETDDISVLEETMKDDEQDVEMQSNTGNSLATSDLVFDVSNPAGYVTISFVDNGIRPDDAEILDTELYGTAVGTIIDETEVPYVEGESIADVTVRLLNAMELSYEFTGKVNDGFYLSSLNDFELNGTYYPEFGEFNAGAESGWCVRLNNWHINQGTSAIQVEDEDVINWLYTCQMGADVGADFSSKSAEITGITFTDTQLVLAPGFDKDQTEYEISVDENLKEISFDVALENYASVISVKVDGVEVKYRPNKSIAVTSNSRIVISTELEYMDAANNNQVTTYTDTILLQLKAEVNHAPNIKAEYAETQGETYIYSGSYVYIYMDDIFEDVDGDTLTYKATLNGEEVEIQYNSWSKEYYIMFSEKPIIKEYKITANDGRLDSEVFTATCIGTSATIIAEENEPLIDDGDRYYYYVCGTAKNDTFGMEYSLDVDADIETEWTSSNNNILINNGDGTFTVNTAGVTSRTQLYVGVTCGKDEWGSLIYLGTKYIYIIPETPSFTDITVELPEHVDNVVATNISNAVTGGLCSNEFMYEMEDESICDFATYGSYGYSITPKKLGTTTVTATFKYDDSIKETFDITVTGRSLQMKEYPGKDSVVLGKDATVQMEVLGGQVNETFTWTSSNEDVASIDENGLVTVKALGTSYITAESSLSTEEKVLKASMYLQVKEDSKVYLDDLAITDYTYFEGFISAKSAFQSATLNYDWNLSENRYTYNKLAFTPYFNDENLDAVLHYQVSGGNEQTMELVDGKAVSITEGLAPGNNTVVIDVYPSDDKENITTYTMEIFRPYNPSNTVTRMTIYPNGDTALAYPTYLDNKEGTIFQYDVETGELVTGWNGRPATGWSSNVKNYKTYVFDARTSNISIYPTFAYVGQRVMIYVNGEALEEGVTNWKSSTIPVEEGITEITLHVNSEKYHTEQLAAGVKDPFAEPENIYTLYVETVTPLGIDSKILSAELSTGEFYKPGFSSDTYTIAALIPSGETSTELTFTVPEGIDVYKTSVTDANKLEPVNQDENDNKVFVTETVKITGTGMNAYSTTNIILQVTDEETGNIGKTQYAFTVNQRGTKDVYPDSIVEYLCIGSQYTNQGSYGTMPERTLKNGGGTLSLGNFGGYITYKYDTPIQNSPNNPYGVDFVIYGNSFGNGGHEPGYVQVSQDGKNWYTLAGSEHFEDHNDWGYSMTYTNVNGKSSWTNSDGESGTIYNYPLASAYPYFTWTKESEQSMTVSGYRLNSSAKDAYGSAAAVLPVFGYVDVNTNGTINGISNNPYNHPGTLVAGGDMFDLDWAVDAHGTPVALDSVSYVRIATASSIYAGAIGEKSTEVSTVNRVTNTAETAVGETEAPKAIIINGMEIEVPANGETKSIKYEPLNTIDKDAKEILVVNVDTNEDANVYINNLGADERRYVTAPEKGIIRIIVQEGEKEPYICYLTLKEHSEEDKRREDIYISTGDYLEQKANDYPPTVASIGGDWLVLGLARSGRDVTDVYYQNVVSYVQKYINNKGQLDKYKSTENARVILALTAAGYDVTNVAGHNLLEGLTDMSYVRWLGNNGAIWALIAFDSHDYEIPIILNNENQVTRDKLIADILASQLEEGGWNAARSQKNADIDMTGMAIQALAPYYDSNEDVKTAVDKALTYLSEQQYEDGSYGSIDGKNSESCAQVIVALTALGINPDKDPRFIKDGKSVLDALCTFYVDGGGFMHVQNGTVDGMSSEQAYYALVSYMRFINNQTSLYDMSDVTIHICPAAAFKDVNVLDWYHEAVDYVLENGLMNGKGNGIFDPNTSTTRAEVAALLYRMEDSPEIEGMENPFKDVRMGDWFYEEVVWAANTGVVTGTSKDEFTPNTSITREQVVTMLYRYASKPEMNVEVLNDFPDSNTVSSYAKEAMAWAVENGIINGVIKNEIATLSPQGTATRAQLAKILMKYLEK